MDLKANRMFPRAALLRRWALALLNAADGGSASRRMSGKRPSIDAMDIFARVSRLKDREVGRCATPRTTDAEKAARLDAIDAALHEAFAESPRDSAFLHSGIFHLVYSGKLSPSQAEAWAAMFGWKPLAGWADPDGFDPMKEVAWSLPMASAWIRFRDDSADRRIDEVRRKWRAYIEQSTIH